MQAWKHAHQRVQREAVSIEKVLKPRVNKADIHTLLTHKQMTVHRDQVRKRRQVLERVIDVVKVIGKCGLSYRGHSHEATNDLENTAINHGEENSEDERHRRLGVAKDEALRKVFGKFAKPDNALYRDLVITMEKIEKDVTMTPVIRSKAQGYKAALRKYETILTAEIFLRIFEQTIPLSKYVQTSGMDVASAQHLVTGTEESLRNCARGFQGVMRAADDCCKC
ncbi:hypothetical protein QQF64_018710 [Cirrhinus molitorella]|uniref:Uncharacterized protein n=1 Tax=Cirrhinus molitorella TaxID=172907 RepID=A0ABR3LGU0_9TELE